MNHAYTSVNYDGHYYHYICSCGHTVKTTDGRLPVQL